MAKIAQVRFPDPPDQYDPRPFAELIRQLEQVILQLNSSYQEDNKNEILAESTLLKSKNLADVITIPDLLTPGIKASTCTIPISIAFL